jgi:hypothetical protein
MGCTEKPEERALLDWEHVCHDAPEKKRLMGPELVQHGAARDSFLLKC